MTRRWGRRDRTVQAAAAALTCGLVAGLLAGCGTAGDAADEGADGGRAVPPDGGVIECPNVRAPGDSAARQVRGMWIATVSGVDWPSDPDRPAVAQQAEYRRLLDTAKALNLNTVVVQVRPTADAFYRSPYEPWSQWITGEQGRDPGYDVLGFMVKEAHARDLEFHAWFNPYRVTLSGTDLEKLAPSHPARRNPGWVRRYGGKLWYDPGLPQVRDLAVKAVVDVVRKYDVDAVHFDDYFYPYPESGAFPDTATYKKHGAGLSRADWRRRNVDTLVRTLSRRVRETKPHVRFGISPFGVWRNKSTDPAGSATRALQSHDDIYADTRGWVRRGWIDYVTPQLYWPIGDSRADYKTLVAWWAEQVEGTKVQLTIGQAGYRVGEDEVWRRPAELADHLTLNRKHPRVRGDVFFSAKSMAGDKLGFAGRLRSKHYAVPAIPPPATVGRAPAPARAVRAEQAGGEVRVRWQPGGGGAVSYGVYRVAGREQACAPIDPADLLTTVRATGVRDASAKPGETYTYYVTALDRGHHESVPARGTTVTVRG